MVCRGTPFRLFGTLNCSSSGGAGLRFIARLRRFLCLPHISFSARAPAKENIYINVSSI